MSYLSCVNGFRLPLCTTEEVQQLKIQGTLLQFEDSWASWTFISFKQQDGFLAGSATPEHVFTGRYDPVDEKRKIDECTLMC